LAYVVLLCSSVFATQAEQIPEFKPILVGDNVWVRDGKTDHAAIVLTDLDNLFRIQWSTGAKAVVEKSRVTSMDLTADRDDGPRRSRRKRCEPIKNESQAKKPAPQRVDVHCILNRDPVALVTDDDNDDNHSSMTFDDEEQLMEPLLHPPDTEEMTTKIAVVIMVTIIALALGKLLI
jgi:hypothetical protein